MPSWRHDSRRFCAIPRCRERIGKGRWLRPDVEPWYNGGSSAEAEHDVVPATQEVISGSTITVGRRKGLGLRTEKEKMLAGEVYNCLDPDLEVERQKTKALLRRYNRTEVEAERQAILKQLLGRVGQNSIIEPPFYCSYGQNTYVGDHVFLNVLCTILDCNEVHIGDHVMIGPAVQIYTAAHHLRAKARIQGLEMARPIVIEENAWIGGGAILLPGVTVGRNAVVGAGAVVSRDVPANSVVVGNPARVIKEIEQ